MKRFLAASGVAIMFGLGACAATTPNESVPIAGNAGPASPEARVDTNAGSAQSVVIHAFPADSVAAADREDLAALIAASRDVLTSLEFAANAETLAATYPQLFYNNTFGNRSPAWGVRLLQNPQGMGYFMRTPVMIDRSYNSGAITGDPGNGWRMLINGLPLSNWRSRDAVQKSCAINTIAHEMTHTLILNDRGRLALIDGGLRAARSRAQGTTASYVMGQLAQCTYLQRVGRIAAADVPACVPVFYANRIFANSRCDDYPSGTRVVYPRRP